MSDKNFRFEGLAVYERSLDLTNRIYTVTKSWPKEFLFDLTNQIRRASLSIPLNIAEGSGRGTKEFKHFLTIARSSCFEIIPLMEIVLRQKLLTEKIGNEIKEEVFQISKMISGLKSSLK